MSTHRYMCQVGPGDLMVPAGDGHIHACKHEYLLAGSDVPGAEHECECGMTWIYTPGLPAIFKAAGDVYWTEQPAGKPSSHDSIRMTVEHPGANRLAVFFVAGFALVGLMCIIRLGGKALGWWG